MKRGCVIQDLSSFQFVRIGPDGDLDLTPRIRYAHVFYDRENAVLSAMEYLERFNLFEFYTDQIGEKND